MPNLMPPGGGRWHPKPPRAYAGGPAQQLALLHVQRTTKSPAERRAAVDAQRQRHQAMLHAAKQRERAEMMDAFQVIQAGASWGATAREISLKTGHELKDVLLQLAELKVNGQVREDGRRTPGSRNKGDVVWKAAK